MIQLIYVSLAVKQTIKLKTFSLSFKFAKLNYNEINGEVKYILNKLKPLMFHTD